MTQDALATSTFEKTIARAGLGVVSALALAKLALHLLTSGAFGYSYFVDELYYLACSEHLAWGYVDMPPLWPAVTAAVRWLLGDSLLAIRLVPALCGAGLVFLTGLFARELGGRRFAQGLSALAVLAAPIYLAGHSLHTMNAFEPILWTGCAYLLVRLLHGGDPRLWLAFGAVAGVGLLNKHSMALFGFALVAGILATPLRRAFAQRWIWLGGLIAFVIFLPNLIWLIEHRFPHFEMLANIRADGRNVALNPLEFLAQQVLMLNPLAAPLWLLGLGSLLFAERGRYRALGVAFLTVLVLLLVLDGRMYYLAPAYPMLFAGGAVAFERWLAARGWGWLKPVSVALVTVCALILAPTVLPCLPPETYIRYAATLGIDQPRIETHRLGPLPQLFADRFGWREMAEVVARAYHSLPPEEQKEVAIFGQNYGQAGAIDLFGPALGLPKAISGHLAYHAWGPRGATGEVMIVMEDDRETLERYFASVESAGFVHHPYSMPYENFEIFICRKPRQSLAEVWPRLRHWN